MPMHSLIENIVIIIQKHLEFHSNSDIPTVKNNGDIVDFNEANVANMFDFQEKIAGQTGDD